MLNFTRLCREFAVPFLESGHHHCHEGWVQVHCPFCTDGTHGWHLGYALEHGTMNCWRCGSHHVTKFLAIILRHRTKTVRQVMAEYSTDYLPTKKTKKPRRRKAKRPPRMEEIPPNSVHDKYLVKRGFKYSREVIETWDLWATRGLSGDWSWRIVAPIFDRSVTVVAYTGRALHKHTRPKWKTSRNEEMSVNPNALIYGIHQVHDDRVLIVEGVSDVWRMGEGAVGLLGIDWKIEQAAILKGFSHRFIMFDPETQAQRRAKELADWLAPFPGETEIISDLKSDPGDLSQDEADNIMKELGFNR